MAEHPQFLGNYTINRVIGSGAMGVVYKGFDNRLRRPVAIKTIRKAEFGDWSAEECSARFLREARAVALCNHPNIVQVYDFGEERDISFIVMEFVDGGKDLKAYIKEHGRLELTEAVRIIAELFDALDVAHEAGVVHRDIKPANVMLDTRKRAKLTDFGVARLVDNERTRLDRTQAGTMVGTPAYMSPEQVLGHHIDHRTDIFSAGVVLYECLTGTKPFEGGSFTLAKKIIESEPPPPSSVEHSISPELDKFTARAMSKDPRQRFSTAREAAEALRRVLDSNVSPAFDNDKTLLMPEPLNLGRVPPSPKADETYRVSTKPRQVEPAAMQTDLEFWRSIKDSDDALDMELYVEKFPTGIYVDLARRKIGKLRRGSSISTDEDTGVRDRQFDEEFWRSIKESDDPDDMELYVEKFPQGIFVDLALRKIAKLRRGIRGLSDDSGTHADFNKTSAAQRQVEARRDAEWRIQRDAAERAERERARREAEEEAKRVAVAQAERERMLRQAQEQASIAAAAKAKREAEERVRLEAEEEAKRVAAAQAERERLQLQAQEQASIAAAAKAKREADELARREALEEAKRVAAAQAERERLQLQAQEQASIAAAAKAKREAEERARREAEEEAKRVAAAQAEQERLRAQEQASVAAAAKAKLEAEERTRREALEEAKRVAAAQAERERLQLQAKEQASVAAAAAAKAKLEAEERTRREAEEEAKRVAAAQAERERLLRQAQERASLAAVAKAKREADEQAEQAEQAKVQHRPADNVPRETVSQDLRQQIDESAERADAIDMRAANPTFMPAKANKNGTALGVGVVAAIGVLGVAIFFAIRPTPSVVTLPPVSTPSSGAPAPVVKVEKPINSPPAPKSSATVTTPAAEQKPATVSGPATVPVSPGPLKAVPQARKTDDIAEREAADKRKAERDKLEGDSKARLDKMKNDLLLMQAKSDALKVEEAAKRKSEEERLKVEAAAKLKKGEEDKLKEADAAKLKKAEQDNLNSAEAEKKKSKVYVAPTF